MASLELKNIYKVYPNGTKAVNDFSMEIEDKEFIVFVGPSGCGKSTVLRMIAGLEEISAGELKIDGEVVNDLDCKNRDTAMVFQNYALYPHMTVADNMAFPLKMTKLTKAQKAELREKTKEAYPLKKSQIKEGTEYKGKFNKPFFNTVFYPVRRWQTKREDMYARVIKIAEILGLEEYLGKKPGAMSGGQRQRVALGRAMVRNPKVFLLDEPLSNLDAKLRTQMRSEITKLHNRLQTTFIYVTHDQVEAMTMGDRIVVMKKGRIQQTDTPINLYRYPTNLFVAGFIGTPAMNFFDAVVHSDGTRAAVEFAGGKRLAFSAEHIKKFERKYLGKHITMGVRPEDFFLCESGAECVVLNTEMLGSETLLYCDFDTQNVTNYESGKYPFIVKTEGVSGYKSGDIVNVGIDFSKAHYFDKESEESVMKRFVSYNEVSASVRGGAVEFGGQKLPLPPAVKTQEGEYSLVFPTDAIFEGDAFRADVLECERLKEGWLARLSAGGCKLYALFQREVKGEIGVDILWHKVCFYRGEEVAVPALKTQNVFDVRLAKRKLPRQKGEKKDAEKERRFDVDVVCGETALTCPLSVLKRLLSASDRKLFGVEMQLIFDENSVTDEKIFTAEIIERYDYGNRSYALCDCLGKRIVLPLRGENTEIPFGIDLNTASVFDEKAGIKIT